MTHEEKREIVISSYQPGEGELLQKIQASPREYATLLAQHIRKYLAGGLQPRGMTIGDALEIADGLERGDFDDDLAGQMGYA